MAAPAAMRQEGARMVFTPEEFLKATKAKTSKVITSQAFVEGGRNTFQLPQSGLLNRLWIYINGSIAVGGTVTSGTLATYPYPAPFSAIKSVKLSSNQAFQMRDLTGWDLYKWCRYRHLMDLRAWQTGVKYSANNIAALGMSGNQMEPAANIVAQTYVFKIGFPLPVAYNQAGEQGLLVLQQNSVFYNLTIDWGTISSGLSATGGTTDIFKSLVGTSLTYTVSITITVGMEWFEFLAGVDNLVSAFMSVWAATQDLVAGENTYKLPQNDTFTFILAEIVNNAAPVAVANITSPKFLHNGNVIDYDDDYETKLVRSFVEHRLPPMDGCIDWDMGLRRGIPARRDVLDGFNNVLVTDAQFRFTLGSGVTLTAPKQITVIHESLRPVQMI